MKVESFVVGKDKFPDWFNEQAAQGRARTVRDDDGQIVHVVINNTSGVFYAKPGDSVMKGKTGLLVIPQKTAQKYHVQGSDKNDNGDERETNFKETT